MDAPDSVDACVTLSKRPRAEQLLIRTVVYDLLQAIKPKLSIFGVRGRDIFILKEKRERELLSYKNRIRRLLSDLDQAHKEECTRI
jgi:hypothetical protein